MKNRNLILSLCLLSFFGCSFNLKLLEPAEVISPSSSTSPPGALTPTGSGTLYLANMDVNFAAADGSLIKYNNVTGLAEVVSNSYAYELEGYNTVSNYNTVPHPGHDTKLFFLGHRDPGNNQYDFLVFDTLTNTMTDLVDLTFFSLRALSGNAALIYSWADSDLKFYPGSGTTVVNINTYFSLDGVTNNVNHSNYLALGKGFFAVENIGTNGAANSFYILDSYGQVAHSVALAGSPTLQFLGASASGAAFVAVTGSGPTLYYLNYSPYSLTTLRTGPDGDEHYIDYFGYPLPNEDILIAAYHSVANTAKVMRVNTNGTLTDILSQDATTAPAVGGLMSCGGGCSNFELGFVNKSGTHLYFALESTNFSNEGFLYDYNIASGTIRTIQLAENNTHDQLQLAGDVFYVTNVAKDTLYRVDLPLGVGPGLVATNSIDIALNTEINTAICTAAGEAPGCVISSYTMTAPNLKPRAYNQNLAGYSVSSVETAGATPVLIGYIGIWPDGRGSAVATANLAQAMAELYAAILEIWNSILSYNVNGI